MTWQTAKTVYQIVALVVVVVVIAYAVWAWLSR
jgi:hypothetical protein